MALNSVESRCLAILQHTRGQGMFIDIFDQRFEFERNLAVGNQLFSHAPVLLQPKPS